MKYPGLYWLGLCILGPAIWAATFTAVYGLHGVGCVSGWPQTPVGPVSLHRAAMLAPWGAGSLAGLILLLKLPRGRERAVWLPYAGAVTGLAATLFTLSPVVLASTC